MFFVADWDNGQQTRPYLWKSDGTTSGTELVQSNFSEIYTPKNLIPHNGWLYFSGADEYDGTEPWKSDGSLSGTVPFKNINPTTYAGSNPEHFTSFNDKIYFYISGSSLNNRF